MRKLGKKLVAVALAAIMVLCAAPLSGLTDIDFAVSAKASGESLTSGIYTYTVDEDGNATITDCDSSASGDIEIPSKLDGNPVTAIGSYAFQNCYYITSVVIPEGVTAIGYSAFYYCEDMTNVTIPEGVTDIDGYAFACCYALTSVEIPASVTQISYDAFYNSSSLASVTFAEGSKLETIGREAFRNTAITSITIPASVNSIAYDAFESCGSLVSINVEDGNENFTSVDGVLFNKDKTELICYPSAKTATSYTVPAGVKTIGNSAFYNNTVLTSVTLPDGLEKIEAYAFYSMDNLTAISIPASVESVEYYAFAYCGQLADIELAGDKTAVDSNAFYSTACYNNAENWDMNASSKAVFYIGTYLVYANYNVSGAYTVREGTTVISEGAFQYRDDVTSVTLPASVEYIGDHAFAYCDGLTSINIPDNVTLGDYVFYNSTALATIDVGSNVKGIDMNDIKYTAFADNESNWENGALYFAGVLLDVETDIEGTFTVKEGTTEIGDSAFASCFSLTEVVLPAGIEKIGSGAFTFCANLASINLPDGLKEIGDGAFAGCFALKSAVVPSTVTELGDNMFALDIGLESVTLPAAITEIPELMFACCVNLKNVPINANTTAIGNGAFIGCTSFTSVNISAKVEEIGMLAFAGCSSLEKFVVDAANANYSSDSYGALFNKDKTVLMSYPSAAPATSYAIPETVTAMEVPFVSCKNLESLNIPAGYAADEESEEFETAVMALLISTVTMKVDINSLIAKIASYGEDAMDFVFELYGVIEGIESEEQAIAFINDIVNDVLDYINGIEGVDDIIGRIAAVVAEVMEAATLENFKSFTVSDGNPHLYAKDGLLYIKAEDAESGETMKALLTCPAGKTGDIKIDSGIDLIMPAAFALCNVGEIVIPSSITEIYPATFALCKAEKLVIPSTVEELQMLAMVLASITEIEIEDGSKIFDEDYLNEAVFAACFADKIILPDSLEEIPEYYFAGCMTKSYELPDSLKTIGEAAFIANLLLESIDIPDSVESIGQMAFIGGIKLTDVNISENSRLKSISELAFTLTSMSDIYIPAGTEYIGTLALNPSLGGAVDYLVAVLTPALETLLADLAEEGIVLDGEKINATIAHVASWFTKNAGVTVDARNTHFSSENGDLYSYDKTNLIKVAETADGLYEVPSSVINISAGAFAFTGVDEIVISDSVVTIETGALAYSPVTEVTLGAGIKEIPDSTFGGCTLLKRVTILPSVVSIDEDAFEGCSDDLTIVGYANSYAYTYAVDNEIKFETIDGKGYVSLKAPSEVASVKVPVYGHTLANTKVEIYDDGVKIGEVDSGANGYWRTTVELASPADNSVNVLVAKVLTGTDKEAESDPVNVLYSSTVPAFESITCYHGSQSRTITMETLGVVPKAMSFNSYYSFTYEIKLSAYDGTKTLYVVSGGMKLPAVYDARTDTYIATGYFDENNHSYVPEYVTLELGGCTLANTSFRFPFIIDPSGFVYEAVHSNRVEGATASIFFQDENGLAQLWKDAPIFDQESTITTDSEGIFKWDVPSGLWQVKVEKEGYETAYSDWLPVPPPQLEVYIGIVSKLAPTVKHVNGYTDSVDVTFNQYMDISTVNSDNIVITDNEGNVVYGYWNAVDKEVSGKDSSVYYATTFTFYPYSTLEGEYTVSINGVENYADKAIEVPYSEKITVKTRVETLNAPESLALVYGKDYTGSEENVIAIDGGTAAAGMKVNVTLSDNFYVESVSTVTLDENGKATVTINPIKPGAATVVFNLDGTNLVEETEVIVSMPEETKVTGITISDSSAEVQVGAEKQLYANVAPDFATNTEVKWSSSDATVASVDESGRVKGLKAGTATITATTVDGGFTAKCEVKVSLPSFTVTWIIDGTEQTQKYELGAKITAPKAPAKDGYEFKGWTPEVPETMPAENLTFTAVYEEIKNPSEPTTKPSEPTTKPSEPTTKPSAPSTEPTEPVTKPVTVTLKLKDSSTDTIKYGETLILHADAVLPEGTKLVWAANNDAVVLTPAEDGMTCAVEATGKGEVTVTVKVVYDNGDSVVVDGAEVTAQRTLNVKGGFLWKIISFFKNLFKIDRVIEQIFKAAF